MVALCKVTPQKGAFRVAVQIHTVEAFCQDLDAPEHCDPNSTALLNIRRGSSSNVFLPHRQWIQALLHRP
jgi:hypothetical protein